MCRISAPGADVLNAPVLAIYLSWPYNSPRPAGARAGCAHCQIQQGPWSYPTREFFRRPRPADLSKTTKNKLRGARHYESQMGLPVHRGGRSPAVCGRQLGRRARPVGRQGRRPGRHDRGRACPCPPASPSPPKPATPTWPRASNFPEGLWEQELAAVKEIEKLTGKTFGGTEQPAAGLLPLRRQVLHARHDGHRPQHRPERRDRRDMAALTGDEPLRLRLYRRLMQMFGSVVMGVPDEAFEGHHRPPQAGRRDSDSELSAAHWQEITAPLQGDLPHLHRQRLSRPIPTSSSSWPPRRSSSRGTASAPSTTATPPASPTTWARPSTSRPWSSATWAHGLGDRRGDHAQRLDRREPSSRATS
jgi:hypothetical protein